MIRIGIDIDDTLCDFSGPLNDHVNKTFGLSLRMEDYISTDYDQIWKVNNSHEIIHNYIFSRDIEYEPIENSREILKSLKSVGLFEFYAISARDNLLLEKTKEYFEKYYPNIFDGIELCNSYGKTGLKRNKSDICRELGIKIMLDDRPNTENYIVFDQPWNRNVTGDRINSWKELPEKLGKLIEIKRNLPDFLLIGISGKLGSGKDTVCNIIRDIHPSFEQKAFAKRVKETVAALTNTSLEMNLSRDGKSHIPSGFSFTLGQLQQKIGEGLRKLIGNDVWVNCVINDDLPKRCIITDCRYKSEAHRIKILIRVEGDPAHIRRDNADCRDLNHSSEIDLDDYPFEIVIHNDYCTSILAMNVIRILNRLCY